MEVLSRLSGKMSSSHLASQVWSPGGSQGCRCSLEVFVLQIDSKAMSLGEVSVGERVERRGRFQVKPCNSDWGLNLWAGTGTQPKPRVGLEPTVF